MKEGGRKSRYRDFGRSEQSRIKKSSLENDKKGESDGMGVRKRDVETDVSGR